MSDNNKPKINVPRFNLTWLYVIIALIFAFLYFSGDEGSASKEVNYTEFQEMVTKGYADKIVAYDNNTVEMYINHIVDVFKKDANKVGRSPSINVQIGSMEALDKFLDEQTKEGNFTGSIQYEKKSDYFSIILWNVLPFVFLIGIWMFAMRRAWVAEEAPEEAQTYLMWEEAKRSFLKKELTALRLRMLPDKLLPNKKYRKL